MFDLFRSRAKAVRYLLGGLLMLVALSMVVTLIPGYGTGGGQDDNIVAEIGDSVLTAREVNLQVQSALKSGRLPRDMAPIFVPQMIDEMITQRAVVAKARQLGFRVTDDDLTKGIRALIPQLFEGGQFAGKDVYAAVLNQQNMTIPEFEGNVRDQILLSRMQNLVAEGVIVTPAELEREYRRRNEKIKLEYIPILTDQVQKDVKVTPEEIRAFYDRTKSQFMVPEKRNVAIIVVDQPTIAQRITVPEEELKRLYQANLDNYRLPERVQVRHILLKTTDKPEAEVKKIQARAEELLKQLKAGADFAELAKKNSEDPGSAAKGGDLGWIVRGQTVPQFESAAFSLKPKELSGVIKTEYGFHILQVMAKEQAHVQPFDDVKKQLAEDAKRQQVFDTMQKIADDARAQLERAPQQAQEIAAKLGVRVVTAEKVSRGNPLPEIGANPDFEEAYSALPRGGVTPVVQIGNDKLVVGAVTDVQPSRPADLAEVEPQIRQSLTVQRAGTLVDERAKQVLEKARAGGDLAGVAKAMGLEVKTTQEFTLTGAADGIGPASAVQEGFQKPVGAVFGPVALSNGRFICKVASKTPADMSQFAAQKDSLRDELKNLKARERYELFQDSVRSAMIKAGKVKIHKKVVDRITGSYRG